MKKASKTMAIVLVALSAMYIKSATKEQSAHELLLLSNIEALASGEGTDSGDVAYTCAGKGTVNCPFSGENSEIVIKLYSLK